jgi:hypothetical protein
MANDRLKELLRQRALLEEHLEWLESEINAIQSETIETPAAASSQSSAIPANRLSKHIEPDPGFSPSPPIEEAGDPDNAQVVSDLYEELGPETQNSVNDARRGCMTLFALGFIALAVIGLWVWWKY